MPQPIPESVVVNIEDVKVDERGAGSGVGEFLTSLVPHPQTVFENNVDSLAEECQSVSIQRGLEPFVEVDVDVGYTEEGLPFIGAQAHSTASGLEALRQRRFARTG